MSSPTLAEVLATIGHAHGFLRPQDVEALARLDRLRLLLVRWHEGRALAPAQNVAGLIAAAEAGGWTVRDVSLSRGDPAYPD